MVNEEETVRDATRLAGRVTFAAPSVRTRDDFRLTKIGRLHSIPNKVDKNSGPKGQRNQPGSGRASKFPADPNHGVSNLCLGRADKGRART